MALSWNISLALTWRVKLLAAVIAFACGIRPAFAVSIGGAAPGLAGQGNTLSVVDDFQRLLNQEPSDFNRLLNMESNSPRIAAIDEAVIGTDAGEIAIGITEVAEAGEVIGAVAACLGSVVCGVAVGAVALAAAARLHRNDDGSLSHDPGNPPQDGYVYNYQWQQSTYPSASAACGAYVADLNANRQLGKDWGSWTQNGCTENQYGWQAKAQAANQKTGDTADDDASGQKFLVNGKVCPDGSVIGYDGQCPGAGFQPISKEDVAKMLANQALHDAVNNAVQSGIKDGGMTIPAKVTGLTGPSVITADSGQTSTTTDVDAQGNTTTTTTTTTPRDTVSYDPDKGTVTVTPGETVTTTKSDGTTSTTVSTGTPTGGVTTGTSGTGTGSSGQPVQLEDPCAIHPGILGCDLVGTPPTDAPTWSNKNITFAPEDLGMPSGCPRPRTFVVRSINFVLNYQPACDVAPMISPALIAFAALGCALWIIGQVKG